MNILRMRNREAPSPSLAPPAGGTGTRQRQGVGGKNCKARFGYKTGHPFPGYMTWTSRFFNLSLRNSNTYFTRLSWDSAHKGPKPVPGTWKTPGNGSYFPPASLVSNPRDFLCARFSRSSSHLSFQTPVLGLTASLPSEGESALGNNLWLSFFFLLSSFPGYVTSASPMAGCILSKLTPKFILISPQSSKPIYLTACLTPPYIGILGLSDFIHKKERLDTSPLNPSLSTTSPTSLSHTISTQLLKQKLRLILLFLSLLTYNHLQIYKSHCAASVSKISPQTFISLRRMTLARV